MKHKIILKRDEVVYNYGVGDLIVDTQRRVWRVLRYVYEGEEPGLVVVPHLTFAPDIESITEIDMG